MNDTVTLDQVVADFVAKVRHHLRDLGEEERQELTEGLEADLTELVTERGPDALGDPATYAGELRAAGGLERRRRRPHVSRPSARDLEGRLDAVRERWERLTAALPAGLGPMLVSLQPVWWVVRAWVAVELVDFWFGGNPRGWVPEMLGPLGWALTLVAVVVSVQLGRGVLPLGPLRGLPRRLVLLGLNLAAVVLLWPVVAALPSGWSPADDYLDQPYVVPHLAFNGNQVQNVYPYDAQGRPLTGVQLIDEHGQRLSVAGSRCLDYWTNGSKDVYSAFPVPTRVQDENTGTCSGAVGIAFPLASLPPVSLPASVAAGTGQTIASGQAPTPPPSG